jgi:16S rRNA (uracil1498-N3)-methyltransferase
MADIRLYVDGPLAAEKVLPLDRAQSNYLFGVMRRKVGDALRVFDGVSGEWRAEVVKANKKNGLLLCKAAVGPQVSPPDLWLLCAPVKKARTAFIVEKAVEMGVRAVQPIITDYTNERINTGRMQAHAVEAAEQCGATFVPDVAAPVKLPDMLANWPAGRKLMFCDEGREALPVAEALAGGSAGPWAILIGPEGGFSAGEVAMLRAMPTVTPVTLGPRILRADTAAVAALTAWQMALGDWQ